MIRPITNSFSGGFGCTELLDEARHGVAQLRAFALPVRQARAVDTQPLLSSGRLGIVKTDALDKAAVARTARIGNHHIEERTLLGAAACQTNDDHGFCL